MSFSSTKDWLDKELLISESVGLGFGETMNINHVDCPAGEDTRRRLYITVTLDGTLLGYCHNCGSRGFVKVRGIRNIHDGYSTLMRASPTFHLANLGLLTCFRIGKYWEPSAMPDIQKYWNKYSINVDLASKDMWHYGVAPVTGYVLIYPYYTENGNPDSITGCQIRYLTPAEEQPKIKTFGSIDIHIFNPNDSNTVVLCEDRVSALRIAEAGFATCVMNGSGVIRAADAHSLSCMFDNFLVWYDNDNDTVKSHAFETKKVLEMFTNKVSWNVINNDPKNYGVEYVNAVVTAYLEDDQESLRSLL